MIFLSQRDINWGECKLGESTLLMKRWGCTTTAISMLTDYFKCFRSPSMIAANVNFYTNKKHKAGAGLILWANLKFDSMKFDERTYGADHDKIKQALKDPKRACILEVDSVHWVVAYSTRVMKKDDYIIIDPWDGKKKNLLGSYKKITGAAFFSEQLPKTISFTSKV